jgi:hypothetical protein
VIIPVDQSAQIAHHHMRAMVLKLLRIPLRAMPITSPKFPLDRAWTPERAMTTDCAGSTPSSFAAIKNVSGPEVSSDARQH